MEGGEIALDRDVPKADEELISILRLLLRLLIPNGGRTWRETVVCLRSDVEMVALAEKPGKTLFDVLPSLGYRGHLLSASPALL